MRGATTSVPPPAVGLAHGLPPGFVDGPVAPGLLGALDAVLAPLVSVLDDLDAYVDLRYAPDDCARWLGSWLGTAVDERWPAARVRSQAPDLVAALTGRGTVPGLAAGVRACTGLAPDVRDNGGVVWNDRPGGALPGREVLALELDVPVVAGDGEAVRRLVQVVVEDLRPAHVPAVLTFSVVG